MSEARHLVRFPGESDEYRSARNALLEAELDLRKQIAAVAAMRRELPPGGPIKEDYVFEEVSGASVRQTRLSELFESDASLVIYSFMYGPDADAPCPMCSSLLDGLNGNAVHIGQRVNFAVVARSPATRLDEWVRHRGWNNLRLLSSANNTYNRDYHAESPVGLQLPACNVFVRTPEGIHHSYATEILYVPLEGEQPRHMDLMWPLWNVLDLTPEGRGTDWMPRLSYETTAAT